MANRIDIPIFTNDKDFEHYQNIIDIKLLNVEGQFWIAPDRGKKRRAP